MKVIKFGGSSLANAKQLRKVTDIIKSDSERRFVVVSAPGKRFPDDEKVTDLLIEYANTFLSHQDITTIQSKIIQRFGDICTELDLDDAYSIIKQHILALADMDTARSDRVMDAFKASGERNSAVLLAHFLDKQGIPAEFISPKDAGLFVKDIPGDAQILPSSVDTIASLSNRHKIGVIPGFYGYTLNGDICTFSRGGSDITGSLIAAGLQANLYENFTDVDAIYSAHPGLIPNCHKISELTFSEMRELSYSGFTVLHDEALMPAYKANVPVVIKNTNNPNCPGTIISSNRQSKNRPVVGIAGDSGFSSIYMSKYLMNRQLGFGFQVFKILQEFDLQFDHMPSGIDDITLIIRTNQLTPDLEHHLIERLSRELELDTIHIKHDLAMVAIVGEGMKNNIGVAARATKALSEHHVNLEMINQGSSEVSILFGIEEVNKHAAIKALYTEFFPKE